MDTPMDWVTLPVKVPRKRAACDVFKRPEDIPRASVDTLTADDFADLPFSGQYDTRFESFFNKLKSGGDVKMVVLGGSFPAGADCSEPVDGNLIEDYRCAWPARVQAALSKLFPQSSISLFNMAHGGTTSAVILGAIALLLRDVPGGPGQIDLIMVDTLLNDSYESQRWTDTGSLSPDEVVETSYEALVRLLHEVAPQALLVPVIDACEKCLDFASHHRVVASFYGLPLVDYANLWRRTANPELWRGGFHPPWESHQILADVIIGTWAKGFRDLCAGGSAPKPAFPAGTLAARELLDHFQSCKAGISEYYALREGGPQPTMVDGWRLFEDRPGKPGWISEKPGAVLTFRLSFGAEPKLLFTFLRTYENIGSAILRLGGGRLTVQGLDTTNNVSQSHTLWFNAQTFMNQGSENGVHGFSVAPHSQDLMLKVTAPGAKFKIISVVSC